MKTCKWIAFFGLALCLTLGAAAPEWGFWGHRRINRLAVFTLPPELIVFYKKHLEFVTEHAVDPDKRRYATKHEAPRHYIDIDHWGTYPFPEVPRDWVDALVKYTSVHVVTQAGDTLTMQWDTLSTGGRRGASSALVGFQKGGGAQQWAQLANYRSFFIEEILPQYYEETWQVDCDRLRAVFDPGRQYRWDCVSAYAVDHFSEYGILPYHLLQMQGRLTEAFRQGDVQRLLRLSTEMGHYIGDAHVPLHTTENYNGQLTDQVGIHAFWESRLPELFADAEYDFFVGKAEYIEDPKTYFWKVVLDSHRLLDSVLLIEKDLSRTFPQDKQYCYEERLGRTIRTQCTEYAAAYHRRLDGMVEKRMRDAVRSIGSSWYTAWVDAGQPNMRRFGELEISVDVRKEMEELDALFQGGDAKGRGHE